MPQNLTALVKSAVINASLKELQAKNPPLSQLVKILFRDTSRVTVKEFQRETSLRYIEVDKYLLNIQRILKNHLICESGGGTYGAAVKYRLPTEKWGDAIECIIEEYNLEIYPSQELDSILEQVVNPLENTHKAVSRMVKVFYNNLERGMSAKQIQAEAGITNSSRCKIFKETPEFVGCLSIDEDISSHGKTVKTYCLPQHKLLSATIAIINKYNLRSE